ncbi:ScyD/ScyE family protein [Propionibacteriaceae bacterium G1746]
MKHLSTRLAGGALALVLAAGTLGALPTTASADAHVQVIASGLNNPRHLSFTASGDLYVAESGTGGDGPCFVGGEGNLVCYGPTGSITLVTLTKDGWAQRRVVTGLPSLAPPADIPPAVQKGGSASGPSAVLVTGSNFVATVGLGADPAVRASLPLPDGFGALIQGSVAGAKAGQWSVLADIAGQEAATNPINDPDSNPASLIKDGSKYVVADAGGNTVVTTDNQGRMNTIAEFPDVLVPFETPGGTIMIPMQFVPTSVVKGPDGAYYVSQLTGFPFPPGGATIWRFMPGEAPTQYATGLTNVTDLAFAADGSLYAVQIAANGLLNGPIGSLVKIPAGGGTATPVVQGLFAPYGVAIRDGAAYVTTGSVLAGGGQVIRVALG